MQNQIVASAQQQQPKQVLPVDFNKWVRHYVHYDSLTKSFQTQTTNARQMKDSYEDRIIDAMEASHMKNATIQIAGGKISLAEETHPAPLTFINLEKILHEYFVAKGSRYPDETDSIMKFIKEHRKQVTTQKLKREMFTAPALPPPPSA